MRRWFFLLALVGPALLAEAQQRATVDQLKSFLRPKDAAQASDDEIAQKLAGAELTERLSDGTFDQLRAALPLGGATETELKQLRDLSEFLDLPASELPERDPPAAAEQQKLLQMAGHFVSVAMKQMPDFLATRTTQGFEDVPVFIEGRSFQSGRHPVGTTTGEVAYRSGHEVAIEKPRGAARGPRTPGLSSVGEFGPVLATIMADSTNGKVRWSHWEHGPAGLLAVFEYDVPQEASTYQVDFCCVVNSTEGGVLSYHGKPAYHGTLSIDPAMGAVLRVTLETQFGDFDPPTHLRLMVQYGENDLGGKNSICPLRSVVIAEGKMLDKKQSWTTLHLNEVTFTDYRRFGSTVRMLPDAEQK